jgi:hypothetical protein
MRLVGADGPPADRSSTMIFGCHDGVAPENQLLAWTLTWALAPIDGLALDYCLTYVLDKKQGVGGDPGWGIDVKPTVDAEIDITTDPDMSDLEPPHGVYGYGTFLRLLIEVLDALKVQYPERAREADALKNKAQKQLAKGWPWWSPEV